MYWELFADDRSFRFATQRVLNHIAWGGPDIGEIAAALDPIRAGDADSWYAGWSALAERLWQTAQDARSWRNDITARDTYLRASDAYRCAEFFAHGRPDDLRADATYEKSVDAFSRFAELSQPRIEPVRIPFEGTTLPGWYYRTAAPGPCPLIVLHPGFIGAAEELHFRGAAAARERGFNVLTFDGPGHPGPRHFEGMTMRPAWETVVAPVLDFAEVQPGVGPDRIGLWSSAMGSELAVRAAAYDQRVAALVADGGMHDFGAVIIDAVHARPGTVRQMLDADIAPQFDRQLAAATEANPVLRWMIDHGRYVMGGATPREFVRKARHYAVDEAVVSQVQAPTLVCDGYDDVAAAGQADRLFEMLTVEDKTRMRFPIRDGAGEPGSAGGASRFVQARILDWLGEQLLRRG